MKSKKRGELKRKNYLYLMAEKLLMMKHSERNKIKSLKKK